MSLSFLLLVPFALCLVVILVLGWFFAGDDEWGEGDFDERGEYRRNRR